MPSVPARRAAHPAARAAALVLAALAAGACGTNDIGEDEDEPRISAVNLRITRTGGASYDEIVRAGATVQVPVGTSTVVAQPLDANNQSLVLDEPFELRIVSSVSGTGADDQNPLSGVFTFVATTGSLTGTITASTVASQSAVVRLIHVGERHTDFDAAITLTTRP